MNFLNSVITFRHLRILTDIYIYIWIFTDTDTHTEIDTRLI